MSEEAQQVAESVPEEAPGELREPEAAPAPAPNFMKKLIAKPINLAVIIAVVAVVVIAAVVMSGGGAGGGGMFSSKGTTPTVKMTSMSGNYAIKGPQVPATQTQEFPIEFNGSSNASQVTNIYEVKVSCSWTDDYPGSEADSMTFELVGPGGQSDNKTTTGTSGNCALDIKISNITDTKVDDNTNGWVLKVTCDYAGHKDVGPLGFLIYVDAGNNFDAKVEYSYYGHETK